MKDESRLLWQLFSSAAWVRGIILASILYWICIYTYYFFVAIDFLGENVTFWHYWAYESSYLGWPLLVLAIFMGSIFSNLWDYIGP